MRTKYASTRFGIVKRSKGQSAVDAASYISRSVLVSEYDGKTYRPKYHEDLVHCEINLPEYAPEEWLDRAVLWNSVELNEKQKKAQLCRVFLYPDPALLERDIRVSKCGFSGTTFRI